MSITTPIKSRPRFRRMGVALAAILCACLGVFRAAGQATPPLELSADEAAWIAAHPVLRVAATPDWPPFEFVDSRGEYRGITAELLWRFAAMAGLELEPVTDDWSTLDQGLQAGTIDVCPGLQATEARAAYLLFSDPMLSFPHAIYTRSDTVGVTSMDDLNGRRVAVERDYYLHGYLPESHPEVTLVVVDNALEALLSVSRGDADAYVGNVAVTSYLIENNVLPGIQMGPYADLGPLELSIGVRLDAAPLRSILNKAIAALPAGEKRTIIERYIDTRESVALTEAEHDWIRDHPVIRLGIDPEFAPFEYLGKDGSYRGMASDYVRILNERLGINLRVVHTSSWTEAVSFAEEGKLDVLPCVGRTAEREKFFFFSEPYLSYHRVIITRLDTPFFGGVEDLKGLRASVQENSSHHSFVTTKTAMTAVPHKTFGEALTAVARGETDCGVGNAATTAFWIKQLSLTNLRLAVPTGEGIQQLHFGVRKDLPELVSIINKGLDAISEDEVMAIRGKWIDIDVNSGLDIRRVAELIGVVVAIFLVILLLITLHNRRLHREIRARLETEAALRESEEDYRSLVESANSIILRMTPGGEVLFLNSYGAQFFGYGPEEIVGMNIMDTIVPRTDSSGRDLGEQMEELGRDPEEFTVSENENITRDGRRVWIAWTNCPLYDDGGEVEEILCVGNDVTSQRRTADTLRRYEFIVNTVKSMMSVIDSDGCYEAVNDEWCAATGIERERAIGKPVAAAWGNGAAGDAILPRLRRCLNGERVNYEAEMLLPAIGPRICEVTMYPFSATYDHHPRAIVVARDITEQKAAETKLHEAMEAAEAGSRAKSAFLANMSHEIRTPMNAVLGYTQLLQRSSELSRDQQHALKAIRGSGDHLLSLINDILELSRIEAGHVPLEPVTFSVARLLDDLDMMFRVKTDGKGIYLCFEGGERVPPYLVGDLNRIKQVLINLIGNAIKFTERGGITLRVGPGLNADTPLGTSPGAALSVRFEVEDTGCGIPEKNIESVFGSFEQADLEGPRPEGAGLGLTISRNFARLMDGDITVCSAPGTGSCFSFEAHLEVGQERDVTRPVEARSVRSLKAGEKTWRVLVVDDRDTNRDLLCRMLKPLGFVTREAINGREGLDLFQAWIPEIVLIDLVMPVMDGREAIRRIRALGNGGDQPCIIALTASTLNDEKDSVLALGADAFLCKPFREEDLLEAIRCHTGMEFVYSEEMETAETTRDPNFGMDQARIAVSRLPEDLSGTLRSIVTRGAISESRALLSSLRDHDERLARLVESCTADYVLDDLRVLWEEGHRS